MRRLLGLFAILALLAGLAFLWQCRERSGAADSEPVAIEEPPAPEPAPAPSARRPGRLAARPDRNWLAAARDEMADEVEASCGPYLLLSDAADPSLFDLCDRIGTQLESTYRLRFGLEPVGEPVGAILLFADRDGFRRFATGLAGLRAGYAGFSRASRGIVAFHAESPRASFATTLAHELTHLVNRRALGTNLPPWLAEGLSDAIGDSASEAGLRPLAGLRGVKAQAARLAGAFAQGSVGGLARLAALDRDDFDRDLSFDYEQSALVVRMLLSQDDLAPGFRSFLADLEGGGPYREDGLPGALGLAWEDLDRRLEAWLDLQLSLPAGSL